MEGGPARGGGTAQIHVARADLAVGQLAAGLAVRQRCLVAVATAFEALAAAEETARSTSGFGRIAAGSGI